MPLGAVKDLVDALRSSQVLSQKQFKQLDADLRARFSDPKKLANELIRRGWLTPFQVNQIANGRAREIVLGPYILVERLGQGGMGQVYKARHRLMNRLVALKMIRSDRLSSADMVSRFRREILAVASLSHPNIVIAHDAAQVGNKHFLVMEYVEGTSLSQLIKTCGPIPIGQACSYVRQAAFGLQHAHERGLVHRDIKPGNLLVTADGKTVKVLDLGLARLHCENNETVHSLTDTEDIMGTPDYIAPEQTRDFHRADIRADIYSLGCTFYQLLTAQPPFPGGSVVDKFLKHRDIEPVPIELLRPEVPRAVKDVLRKMMAKKPGDRYQTPAEVAAALKPLVKTAAREAWIIPRRDRPSSPVVVSGAIDTTAQGETGSGQLAPTMDPSKVNIPSTLPLPSASLVSTLTFQARQHQKVIIPLVAGLAVLLMVCLLSTLFLFFPRGNSGSSATAQNGKDGLPLPEGYTAKLVIAKDFDHPTPEEAVKESNEECRSGVKDGSFEMRVLPKRKYAGHFDHFDNHGFMDFATRLRLYHENGDVFFYIRSFDGGTEKTRLSFIVYRNGSWKLQRETGPLGAPDAKIQILKQDEGLNAAQFKEKQWNDMIIQAYGNFIEVQVNRKPLLRYEDSSKANQNAKLEENAPTFMFGISSASLDEAPLLKIDDVRIWKLVPAQ